MKKISVLSLLLLMCLLLTVFVACYDGTGAQIEQPTTEEKTESSESGTESDIPRENEFKFTSNGDGTCMISEAIYAKGELTIPEFSPEGELITKIGDGAFKNCYEITSLTIPDSIRNIGEEAFKNCVKLKKVFIGDGLETLGTDAFMV